MRSIRGRVFLPEGRFAYGEVVIDEGKISSVRELPISVIDPEGREHRIIPGLVDIHSHGCIGHDTCEATPEELYEMVEYERSCGITSYCPTTMTYDKEKLLSICRNVLKCGHKNIKGIYLEGPFISKEKKGAQNEKYILAPDADMIRDLIEASEGLAKIIAVAPEVEGSMEVIEALSDRIRFSLAHTNADFSCAKAAFKAGAKHVTHLFNAMPPYNHREPGVIGAAFDTDGITAELICDGIHIHEAVIRSTFKTMGDEKLILISDSMEATGMPDGTYALGGQTVYKKGRRATLSDGTIAGSASTLFDCLRHAIGVGVKPREAIWAATRNPAKAIGIFDDTGSIEVGKAADLLVLTRDYELLEVIQ